MKRKKPSSPPSRSQADLALAEQMLRLAKAGRDVRREKVQRVRDAIRDRSYENELKLQVAVDRMVEEAETTPG